MHQTEWIGLADAVHRAHGLLTRWGAYSAALEGRFEARKRGKTWEVRVGSFDRYLRELRGRQPRSVNA